MKKSAAEEDKAEKVVLSKEEHAKLLEQVKELEAMRDKFLRSAADYDNARKRLQKEREEFIRFAQERLLRDLLPLLDNFERALAHSETLDQGLAAGIQLISKQLGELLSAHGVKRLNSEGQAFDPHLHEAVDQVEEEGPEGVVVKEITPGYLLHDRVLRPAKVRIRVAPRGKAEGTEEKEEEIT
jgi:molecular chaperone GrpE